MLWVNVVVGPTTPYRCLQQRANRSTKQHQPDKILNVKVGEGVQEPTGYHDFLGNNLPKDREYTSIPARLLSREGH